MIFILKVFMGFYVSSAFEIFLILKTTLSLLIKKSKKKKV
jgi:hypothetical protein